MTAAIIPFGSRQAVYECYFREMLEKACLTPEAAEWIYKDAWPPFKDLFQGWQVVRFEGHEEANRTSKDLAADNFFKAVGQILKLEIELCEARFGKSAGR